MHTVMSLRTLFLDPLAHFPRQVRKVHFDQLAVVAVSVHAGPRTWVELFVVEDFELRRKGFKIGVELTELVDGAVVGGFTAAGACVG